jgi:hypothetical protein
MRDFGRDYDKWLDENDEATSDYYYEFQNAREYFLDHECNPHDFDVFMDTLLECEINDDDLKAAIALGDSGYEQLGKVIWTAVYNHCDWKAKALATAKCKKL